MRKILLLAGLATLAGCVSSPAPGTPAELRGDEISVAGKLFHTGTRVVRWDEPGGYDAYRLRCRFDPDRVGPLEAPHRTARFDDLRGGLPAEAVARARESGLEVSDLKGFVRQVVIHYDAAGSSRRCFEILHDRRGLSSHFLLDTDGTVYQTLDVKERAWHAGPANDRSVGIEVANVGAYPDREALLSLSPAGGAPIRGTIRGRELFQRPFTDVQYEALGRLVAALCLVLDVPAALPRDAAGRVIADAVPPEAEMLEFRGVVGHYHVSAAKVDPGPAFDWERLVADLRRHDVP